MLSGGSRLSAKSFRLPAMQGPRDAGDMTLNTHDAHLEQIPLLRSGEVPAALLPIHADHPCGTDVASRG